MLDIAPRFRVEEENERRGRSWRAAANGLGHNPGHSLRRVMLSA